MRLETRRVESKFITYTSASNLRIGSAMSAANNQFYAIIPTIGAGVASYQHLGDEISVKKIRWNGFVQAYNPTNTTYTSAAVRIMVLNSKSYPEATNATFPYIDVLKSSGANTSFTGIPNNLLAEANRDEFEVLHDKVIPLSEFMDRNATIAICDASHFQAPFDFTTSYPVGRSCKYAPGTSVPYSFNPVLLVGYAHLDATNAIEVPAAGIIGAYLNINMWYTDA